MNQAQKILSQLGVPVGTSEFRDRNPSATKNGPGRKHSTGHKKASPIPFKGAVGMALHKASATKKERRALIALHGRRQFLRMLKEHRVMHKAANDERTDALSTRHYEPLETA